MKTFPIRNGIIPFDAILPPPTICSVSYAPLFSIFDPAHTHDAFSPRSNAHARLRPYTAKYGHRVTVYCRILTEYLAQYYDRISPCRLRRDTTISAYKRSLFLKHHCTRALCSLSGIGRIRSKTTSYSLSNGSYTNMNDRIRHGELRS